MNRYNQEPEITHIRSIILENRVPRKLLNSFIRIPVTWLDVPWTKKAYKQLDKDSEIIARIVKITDEGRELILEFSAGLIAGHDGENNDRSTDRWYVSFSSMNGCIERRNNEIVSLYTSFNPNTI